MCCGAVVGILLQHLHDRTWRSGDVAARSHYNPHMGMTIKWAPLLGNFEYQKGLRRCSINIHDHIHSSIDCGFSSQLSSSSSSSSSVTSSLSVSSKSCTEIRARQYDGMTTFIPKVGAVSVLTKIGDSSHLSQSYPLIGGEKGNDPSGEC